MWKKIILSGLILMVAFYSLFQVAYYATSGPYFCAKCHEVKKYVLSWEESPHKRMYCLECHQPRGELGKIHAKARGLNYVFQHFSGDFTVPTQAIVSDQNCLICHLGDEERYPNTKPLKNKATINHYNAIKASQSCLDCHRNTGHDIDIYLAPDLRGAKEQL